ncbi:ABC transporter ATP-binding protein [Sphingomonas elodea]|uniref:ABC transporter ATP-binding protein n=1 Tax=Sphingomonas elodea TaxID=179878 RepID=UPI0002630D0D|nr:ABC transporter ATP-binding protein [Sphingomonas elodea]
MADGLLATAGFGGDARAAFSTLLRVGRLSLPYRASLALMLVGNLLAASAGLALPHLLGEAVDQLSRPGQGPASLVRLAMLLAAAVAARGLFQMLASFSGERVGQLVARDLRLAYFDALQRLGHGFHDAIDPGDLITRGMLDIEGVRGFIEMGVQRLLQITLLTTAGAVVLVAADPVMAVATLACVPLIAWRAGRMGLQLRIAWTRLQREMAVLTRVMEENLHGSRVVRAFSATAHELSRFDAASGRALALSDDRIRVRARAMASINASFYAAMLAVLGVGAWRIEAGMLTLGELTLCLAFMTVLQLPVRQMSMVMNSAARAVSSGQRVFDILDRSPVVDDTEATQQLPAQDWALVFDRVRFRHAADGPWVLDDISFTLSPGRTLGIVGASGSGKSTIAALAARLYDPDAGRVTLGGIDLRDASLSAVRGTVHVVQQDLFLFDDAARRNIDYARPDIGQAAVRDAAAVAQLDDHVARLPEGYDTRVGERGSALSGGQRQRMTIARGLIADPRILILDDATSALDSATEAAFRDALVARDPGRSTILISHRLTSLAHADEILVLDRGRIVERGTHRQLVERGGRYAALDRHQRGIVGPVAEAAE